ncbi:dihydroxyacetone kinase Dak1 [Oleoguttula sp. CCFEE 5521]
MSPLLTKPKAKHFINDPTHLVLSALKSITLTNPTTALDSSNKILYLRPDAAAPQVSIVSGGGSGHEPSFAAFVGPGLLSAAVAGTIFASPSAEQIRRCILQRVEKTKGVLVVVMNYTGDVLNFGMAVEKAKAAGFEVEMVVMADGAGVGRSKGGKSDKERAFINIGKSDETVLLVNNLGGVSVLEMGGITSEVASQLESDYSIKPVRVLSGTFMTSLNGLGFSISLLRLTDAGVGKPLLELLDAPAEAAGWAAPIKTSTWTKPPTETREASQDADVESKPSNITIDPSQASKALNAALDRVIKAEPDITRYDTVVGDGDCGIGLKRGAEGVKQHISKVNSVKDAAQFVDGITSVIETTMDGTSGALYAIFLNALANGLRQQSSGESKPASPAIWAKALQTASESLSSYTPAQPGDRTLIDALAPFVEELAKSGDVSKAAQAADAGSKKTKGMKASLGRTVYVGGSGYEEVPDPGAYGLAEFFTGLAEGLR